MESDQIKFLFDQFKESNANLRHLENSRAQHMAFFFTVLLTSVGVAATTLRNHTMASLHTETRIIIAVWLLVLIALAMLVLIGIKKLGYAHAIHSRFIMWTRNSIMDSSDMVLQMFGEFGDNHPLANSKIFSVQFTNEAVVTVGVVSLDVALGVWLYTIGFSFHWQSLVWLILVAFGFALIVLQLIIYYLTGVGAREGVASTDLKAQIQSVISQR